MTAAVIFFFPSGKNTNYKLTKSAPNERFCTNEVHNQIVCVGRLKLVLTKPEVQICLISTMSELIYFN